MSRWFWIYLLILVAAYGTLNTTSSLNDFLMLKSTISNETNFHQFFDCELLTSPSWIGFLNSFLSGYFLDPSSMTFEPFDPLLKVNYSQGMADTLMKHSIVPYMIGSFIGTGVTLFLLGGFLALIFLRIQRKECQHD
ncbi:MULTISPECIES: hypothetical protein [Vibrio]|uniref:hypothetical protein n=1 Tax=Vibrio TaxID=662 RepID=UPI001C80A15F|nr:MULTISPECIES: hypothetical protein [Vibrio]